MNAGPIALLTPADLDFAVVNYDFTSLTASELQDLPNPEAAIDELLAEFAADLAAQQAESAAMDADIAAMQAVIDEMEVEDFFSILVDIGAASDAMFATIDFVDGAFNESGLEF